MHLVKVNEWCDVLACEGKWLPACVMAKQQSRKLFHFRGWKPQYDEWLDTKSASDCERFAPFQTATPKPSVLFWETDFVTKIGDKVLAQDTVGDWCTATILRFNDDWTYVYIDYEGWIAQFQEWIPVNKGYFRPLHFHFASCSTSLNKLF